MPDETAFIRTILADPEADGPRLVYADWLEEQGDAARAEFIRVQVELARWRGRAGDRVEELRRREESLLKRHRRSWLRRLGSFVRDVEFRRGLIEQVTMTAPDFVRYGSRALARAPVLGARLTGAGPLMRRVAASAGLRQLRFLHLENGGIRPARLRHLTESPNVVNLRSLGLRGNPLADAGATLLAASPHLANLRFLWMERCWVGASGLMALGDAMLPKLELLSLAANGFDPGGLEPFLGGRLALQLKDLDLSMNTLSPAGARSVARSTLLANLNELNLSFNQIGDDGAAALANSAGLAGLDTLQLWSNEIGPRGGRALAQSRHLGGLQGLFLGGNRLGPAATRLLQRRFGVRLFLD